MNASAGSNEQPIFPPPGGQAGNPPPQPPNPEGSERDEEMHSDRGAHSDSEEAESPAMKRKRTEQNQYTVSKPGSSFRDQSLLRKVPPQCTWDKEARAIAPPTPPAEFVEWVRLYVGKQPFNPEYNEAIYARIPTYRYANPHFRNTQCGSPEEMPLDNPGPDTFTPGPFPHTHISDWHHTGNIQKQQRDMLWENKEKVLMLIPHGGGRAYMKHAPALVKIYEKCLHAFRFKGYDGAGCDLTVMAPDVRNEGNEKSTSPFAQPWGPYVLLKDDTADLLRTYLIWQEHFAFDQSRSFSIYPLETANPQSWKLLLLVCPDLDWAATSHNDVLDRRSTILDIVKAKLKAHNPYHEEIAMLAAMKINHTGTRDQIFKTVTDSFHLELASADLKDSPVAVFILLARPLTTGLYEHKSLKRTMIDALGGSARGAHFYAGTGKVLVVDDSVPNATILVDCKLCKSDMHCTTDCPLPKMRGWCGITAAALGQDDKPDEEKAAGSPAVDPNMLIGGVLSNIRGELSTAGPSKPRKMKGNFGRNGQKNRHGGQSGQGGGKGKGPARG